MGYPEDELSRRREDARIILPKRIITYHYLEILRNSSIRWIHNFWQVWHMITGCACVHVRVHTLVGARACVYVKSARLKNFFFCLKLWVFLDIAMILSALYESLVLFYKSWAASICTMMGSVRYPDLDGWGAVKPATAVVRAPNQFDAGWWTNSVMVRLTIYHL